MLSLDDQRWSELKHAYGSAADIPALLENLKSAGPQKGYDTEPWFSLWSALCHQYDVYPASFAAVPHIIAAAAERIPQERLDHLLLSGSIEAFSHLDDAPPIPDELKEAYVSALNQAKELTLECLRLEWDETRLRTLLGAAAAFSGKPQLASAIFELEKETDCPHCEQSFMIRGYDLFH
jgi:hypothetical protein